MRINISRIKIHQLQVVTGRKALVYIGSIYIAGNDDQFVQMLDEVANWAKSDTQLATSVEQAYMHHDYAINPDDKAFVSLCLAHIHK